MTIRFLVAWGGTKTEIKFGRDELAKGLSCPEAQSFDEEAVEECLNIDKNAPATLQTTVKRAIWL